MEVGAISKSGPIAGTNAPQRIDPHTLPGAVKTQLPEAAAVTQTPDAPAVRFDLTDNAQSRADLDAVLRQQIENRLTIDAATRAVVYQSVDRQSGMVVRQIPDEALLRLRTYMREAERTANQDQDSGVPHVERIA